MGIRVEVNQPHKVDVSLLRVGDTFELGGDYYLITYYGQVMFVCLNTSKVLTGGSISGKVTPINLVMKEEIL